MHVKVGRQVHGTIVRPDAVDVEEEDAGDGPERLHVHGVRLALEFPDERHGRMVGNDESDRREMREQVDEGVEGVVVALDQVGVILAQTADRSRSVPVEGLDPQGHLLQVLVEVHEVLLKGVHLPEEVFLEFHHLLDQLPLFLRLGYVGKGDLQREYPAQVEDQFPFFARGVGCFGHPSFSKATSSARVQER